jgi:hypothetical protein
MKGLLLMGAALLAQPSFAQDGDPLRFTSEILNDAALLLATHPDPILAVDVLSRTNGLRVAAETDPSGRAALAYFELIDRLDVPSLREVAAEFYDPGEHGLVPNRLSICFEELERRASEIPAIRFWQWQRGQIPDAEWTTAGDWYFVVAGMSPLIRLVEWHQLLVDAPPGTPLSEEQFDRVGEGFQTLLTLSPADISEIGNVETKPGRSEPAFTEGEVIVGLLRETLDPDFALGTFTIPDYTYCILPPTPADLRR